MKIVLEFPKELLSKPVISETIKKFDADINILRGKADKDRGEFVVEVTGKEISEAVEHLKEEGILVTPAAEKIFFDEEKCISCGACMSLCPGALYFDETRKVRFDEEKCILCKNCVTACPVRAVEIK